MAPPDEPAPAPDRRTFLQRSGLALSALALGCEGSEDASSAPRAPRPILDPALLRAVASVLLPAEIGEQERERAVAGFERWVEEYEPVPERVHAYGSQEIRYGPADPAPRWAAQLEAIDVEARKRHGRGLTGLGAEERRRLVEGRLSDAPARLPGRPGALEAEQIEVGLLAWFFGRPAAIDLCYGRRIDGLSCRPLATSGDRPPPIGDGPVRRGRESTARRETATRDPTVPPRGSRGPPSGAPGGDADLSAEPAS